MKPTIVAVLLASLLFNSCGTSKQEQMQSEEKKSELEKMKNPLPAFAPGTCKVVATIEVIDKALKGTSEKDPCSKAPCMATINVDSVLGYGSAFPTVLAQGKKLRVKFMHTLNPTKDVWPEIQPPLPGLRAGHKFEAVITGSAAMGKQEPDYTIYRYDLK
jgi:hypothetical protein